MAHLVQTDTVVRVTPGTTPPYDDDNPLPRLLRVVEETRLAAAREAYVGGSLQYLLPLAHLELWGPSAPNSDELDPTRQDVKTDFQKQNVRDFHLGDTRVVRGWAVVADEPVPFLHLSYRAGPDSQLSQAAGRLGESIGCTLQVQGGPVTTVRAPYDPESGRYVTELWATPGDQLRDHVDARGAAALDAGTLQGRMDMGLGAGDSFARQAVDGRDLRSIAPTHVMHPVNPVYIDVRWSAMPDGSGPADPPAATTRLGFEMKVRGWTAYLGVGTSPNPHGGIGFLEYRNLFSNYGAYAGSGELTRRLDPWNLDAFGQKGHPAGDQEAFMAVDYMDLHVLEPSCGIGLHRHRDNQEVFLMLDGEGTMVVGDWADSGTRQRCFEIRTLTAGHLALLRGGNLHALANPTDRRTMLFMFGGYD